MGKVSREELLDKISAVVEAEHAHYINKLKPEIGELIDQYTDAIVDEVIGEDEITYANYEDGFFVGKKVTRDKLRTEQRQRYQAMKDRNNEKDK